MASTDKSKKQTDTKATVSTAGGGTAGALAGAGIGAAVGGPVGAAIGAGVGAVAGAATGGAIGYESHEAEFRRDFEASGDSKSHTWESVSPAYRYGFESSGSPEYHGRSYGEVSSKLKKGWTGHGEYSAAEPYIKQAYDRRAALGTGTAGAGVAAEGGVIPVVEEELQVGKRTKETGGVRVTTSVTETPVEADVKLHHEKVKVHRRAVDRPVTDADAAFREGTIELKETAEEAVVHKRARVIEEIVLSKEGHDTTHKVRDKVRKTDVDVKEAATPTKVTHETYESFKPVAEAHHKANYASSGVSLEEFTPAYRYGHTLATDSRYGGGDWATVEPEARKHWEAKNEGTWEEFKEAVHHAWDKVRGKA